MNIIIIPITLFLVWIFYKIIKYHHTETVTTLLEILRDTQDPKVINKVVNKHFKYADTIRIYKHEKFVFGKLKSTKIELTTGYYSDYDDDWDSF